MSEFRLRVSRLGIKVAEHSSEPAAELVLTELRLGELCGIAITMDNVLRPYLIRRGADLPLLLIFAGVIGGLIGFGLVGLFVGPVVLAVTYRLVEEWVIGEATLAPPAETAAVSRRPDQRKTERQKRRPVS